MERHEKSPLRIGWESAKANIVPIVILWLVAACLVVGYYCVSGVSDCFALLARWQRESGWSAAFLNRVIFCGALPGFFWLMVKSIRPRRPVLTILVQMLWSGCWGVVCNWFYHLQDWLVGSGIDVVTLIEKTAINQLPWTVLVVAPANAVFYFWMSRDLSVRRFAEDWPRGAFFRKLVLSNLVTNWIVWIPVVFSVYVFPLPLQIQVSGLFGAVWALLILQISAKAVEPRCACDSRSSRFRNDV